MELVNREEVLDAIDEVTEIRGTVYIDIVQKITDLPTRAVIRDCNGCMGAAFGDCQECKELVKSRRSGDE